MPYIRKGKCVFKKSGKKVGCSATVSKAKDYLKALHANVEGEETFNEMVEVLLEKYKPKKKKKGKLRARCQAKAKVKYDVWPSAYASGYVQKCIKRGGKIG